MFFVKSNDNTFTIILRLFETYYLGPIVNITNENLKNQKGEKCFSIKISPNEINIFQIYYMVELNNNQIEHSFTDINIKEDVFKDRLDHKTKNILDYIKTKVEILKKDNILTNNKKEKFLEYKQKTELTEASVYVKVSKKRYRFLQKTLIFLVIILVLITTCDIITFYSFK
jgi:hypothetical protein